MLSLACGINIMTIGWTHFFYFEDLSKGNKDKERKKPLILGGKIKNDRK